MPELRRSFAYAAAQSYIGVALQLVSTVVLSRVLTPAELGVFVIASAFGALATNFRDFGIAEYLIQARALTHDNIRAAFAVNIALSWLMGLAMFVGAGFVGDFYRSQTVAAVMQVQSISFLLIPFGAINQAWFRREMNFKPIFVAGVLSDVVALSLAVVLALRGHGALSLAWSSVATIAVSVAVSLYFRPADFPRWPGLRGVGEVLRFGSFASGIYVLGQLGRSAPEMIIGRVQGVADVAIFSRGGGLVQLFRQLVLRAVTPVCLPYFAQSVRDEGRVGRAYLRGVAIFTVVGWTFLGFLALEAFPAIRAIYGVQWAAAVPLAQVLCLVGAVDLVHNLAKEALLAQGAVRLATRLQALQQVAQVLGVSMVVPFGLIGACWGMLAAAVLNLVLAQWHLHQEAGLAVAPLLRSCAQSARVALPALAPAALVWWVWPPAEHNFLRHLVATGSLTALAWLLALRISGHPLWPEIVRLAGPLVRRLATR